MPDAVAALHCRTSALAAAPCLAKPSPRRPPQSLIPHPQLRRGPNRRFTHATGRTPPHVLPAPRLTHCRRSHSNPPSALNLASMPPHLASCSHAITAAGRQPSIPLHPPETETSTTARASKPPPLKAGSQRRSHHH
ncbi:hypothetical protein DAI22_07g277100 [Oryza sativa Japonica Group]|uniref:Uncharacterized protein n=1 Tax=Oryza nivara TaxID=4536 RepID=A0A0E0I5T6_ORYNI|nr:hypothetical protein DAI22_07g277100 [Oryza sativa Japonica Group]